MCDGKNQPACFDCVHFAVRWNSIIIYLNECGLVCTLDDNKNREDVFTICDEYTQIS